MSEAVQEIIKQWSIDNAGVGEAKLIEMLRDERIHDDTILLMLRVLNNVCHECWNGSANCQCWNDV